MPPTKTPISPVETAEDRFKRIVSPRVNRAMHELEKIEKAASNLARYGYTEAERDRIIDALRHRVDGVEFALDRGLRRQRRRVPQPDHGFRL